MKIRDPGHEYELDSLDGDYRQILVFVKREGSKYPFNEGTHAGTNCQEVLRVLIDRSEYLNRQVPCAETEAIIGNLKLALLLFELRAARRHNRQLNLETTQSLLSEAPCEICGHIGHYPDEHSEERESRSDE